MSAESDAVVQVAGLMALAARTAPKSVGLDSIVIEVVMESDLGRIADEMVRISGEKGKGFFRVNGEQVRASDAMVLIGVKGRTALGLNCGGCGYASCREMETAISGLEKPGTEYPGPNCIFKVSDLGIAVGSAVKTASVHNADNRIMYSAGVAAMKLGMLGDCSIVYGIPLKASGKNIYFDAAMKH